MNNFSSLVLYLSLSPLTVFERHKNRFPNVHSHNLVEVEYRRGKAQPLIFAVKVFFELVSAFAALRMEIFQVVFSSGLPAVA